MNSRRHRRGPKLLAQTQFTSELGVNLVARRVMEMGYGWHPTTAAFDVGIDGFIELRDPVTTEALNLIVQVQVKATEGQFVNETSSTLDFICDERDLAHWRRGNAPVVLVVTRPRSEEAYWVSIKEYFREPLALKERRVRFDKQHDRFDTAAAVALRHLSVAPDAGLYVHPLATRETLFSNLVSVSRFPPKLYSAVTPFGRRFEVVKALGDLASERTEFVYRGKRVLSVHDLSNPEWRGVVDSGTVEPFPTTEWSLAEDEERLTDFTELLGRCLGQRAKRLGMRYNQSREFYYFVASDDLRDREFEYSSTRQKTSRWVFKKYKSKGGFDYYRHSAFQGSFRRYDGEWFLVVTPTYHFTEDGHRPLRFYESKLKGIKALEKNPSVLGQVVFFASILAGADHDLFKTSHEYQFVEFGGLRRFAINVGLDDGQWLPGDDEKALRQAAGADELAIVAEEEEPLELFDNDSDGDELE